MASSYIHQLQKKLADHRPSSIPQNLPEAAVLLALTNCAEPELIFTQRAAHMNSHAGQVAFPGGKRDPEDVSLFDTALREAEEEIALPRQKVTLLGELSQVVSRQGILVNPYIASVEGELDLVANEDELDAIFHVPIEHFLSNEPDWFDCIKHPGGALYIPCYLYQGFEIWGLSAMILSEFLQVGFNSGFDLWQPPQSNKIRYR